MATTISAAHEYKRQDTFRVDTRDVIVDRSAVGRETPASLENIQEMADSISVFGQLQPVEFVKNTAGTLTLVSGFTRFDAVELLNTNTTDMDRVLLWGVVKSSTVQNKEDSFTHNIVENIHRRSTTPLDDAHNQERLRTEFGWSNERIAKLYRCTSSRVSQITRLLNLIPQIKTLVGSGKLTCSAGEDLGSLDEAGQSNWLENEWLKTGDVDQKVTTADVKESVTKARQDAGETGRSMTMASLKKFLKGTQSSEDLKDVEKDFFYTFSQWLSGEADESDMWSTLDALQGIERQRRKAG